MNGHRMKPVVPQALLAWFLLLLVSGAVRAAVDSAGTEAAGMVLGIQNQPMPVLLVNPQNHRLEVRDENGNLLEEIFPGSTSRMVDIAGCEYRLSYGRDDLGRVSVLVRAGPAMKQPITIKLLGRKTVLSPEASVVATIGEKDLVFFEPSICGQVYYVEPDLRMGGEISRRALAMRESAVLARPSAPLDNKPGTVDPATEYNKDMNSAGTKVKSALLTFFGLPDREAKQKARVYRLKSTPNVANDPNAQVPSAEAGRP